MTFSKRSKLQRTKHRAASLLFANTEFHVTVHMGLVRARPYDIGVVFLSLI